MKPDVHAGMLLKGLDKGKIATRVGLLKNMAKIAARLMRVNQ